MSEDLTDVGPEPADDTSPVDVIDAANPTPNTEDLADDAGAEQDDGQDEGDKPKKPPRSAQERINEAVKAQRDAERRAEAAERRAAEIEARQAPRPEQPRQPVDADPEPDPAEYQYGETDPGYIKALGAWSGRQAYAEQRERDTRNATVERVEQTWEQRQAAFAKDKPDFYQATTARDLPITPVMANAIKTSEDGPAVAYHLAQNPDEARRIANLPQLAQVREIGKLEAKLATPAAAPGPKTLTDAPPPHPQARGQGGKFRPSPDTTDFAAFERMVDGASG